MKKLILLITLLLAGIVNAQWSTLGTASFTDAVGDLNLKINSNNVLYAVYMDNATFKLSVQKFDGTNWVLVGNENFTPANASQPSLDFIDNQPVVAFKDAAVSNKLSVMKFDGTNWVYLGNPAISDAVANDIKLHVNASVPYVIFQDVLGSTAKATVMTFNGTNWTAVGTPRFTQGNTFENDLKFIAGQLYISFREYISQTNNKVSVMKYNGTGWVYVGSAGISANIDSELSGSTVVSSRAFNSLSTDPDTGNPVIAIYETNGASSYISVKQFNGTSWTPVGENIVGVSSYGGNIIIRNFNNKLTLGYSNGLAGPNNLRASVKQFDGTAWINLGGSNVSGSDARYITMEATPEKLYLGYADNTLDDDGGATVKLYNITLGLGLDDYPVTTPILYPNSTKGIVKIENIDSVSDYNVYDMTGRIVRTGNLTNASEIDLSAVSSGTYFIEFSTINKPIKVIKK